MCFGGSRGNVIRTDFFSVAGKKNGSGPDLGGYAVIFIYTYTYGGGRLLDH